jgi:hypothetical protein
MVTSFPARNEDYRARGQRQKCPPYPFLLTAAEPAAFGKRKQSRKRIAQIMAQGIFLTTKYANHANKGRRIQLLCAGTTMRD